jgi:ribosomal protein L14E/L6E/L27E
MSNGGIVSCCPHFKDLNGLVVVSKSGHDRGAAYVITDVLDDKIVSVCNGENRPLLKPKYKNICHLAITNTRTAATSDIEIKKAIKGFTRAHTVPTAETHTKVTKKGGGV